jgi:hypothetical protein
MNARAVMTSVVASVPTRRSARLRRSSATTGPWRCRSRGRGRRTDQHGERGRPDRPRRGKSRGPTGLVVKVESCPPSLRNSPLHSLGEACQDPATTAVFRKRTDALITQLARASGAKIPMLPVPPINPVARAEPMPTPRSQTSSICRAPRCAPKAWRSLAPARRRVGDPALTSRA